MTIKVPQPSRGQSPYFKRVVKLYEPWVEFRMYHNQSFQKDTLRAEAKYNSFTWYAETDIDDEIYARSANPERDIADTLEKLAQAVIHEIPETIIGKYPFARLWHDKHIPAEAALLFHPNRSVPGWVFGTINKKVKEGEAREYPKDKGDFKAVAPVTTNYNGGGETQPDPPPPPPKPASPRKIPTFTDIENSGLERAMADTKKKKVVRKAKAPIDPSKVKKPNCAKHDVQMAYSPITEKWECNIEGCNMVARPKRAADDKNVVLGKGEVTLRLVQQGDKTSVILISDDNVALDVTPFVRIKDLIDNSEAREYASMAHDNGRDTFVIATEQSIPLEMKVAVIGVSDFALRYPHTDI